MASVSDFIRSVFAFIGVVLIATPILFLRLVALITAKFKPSLGRPLSAISCLFAIDTLYTRPMVPLVLFIKLDAKIELRAIRESFTRLLESNRYPELKQKLSRWMGFYFWEDIEHFHLENHLFQVEGAELDDVDIENLRDVLVKKPFLKDQPVWDCTLYPVHEETGGSVVVLRVHHCLTGGISFMLLLIALSGDDKVINSLIKRNFKKKSWQEKMGFYLQLFFTGPGLLLKTIGECQDTNDWKVSEKILTGDFDKFKEHLDLLYVKEIARKTNSRVSAILFAAFCGGIRNLMLKLGQDVPQTVTLMCPLPLPNHPDILTNHLTMVPIKAPVGIADPFERLRDISHQFDSMQTSLVPYCFACMMQLSGLITSLLQKGGGSTMGTAPMSNFPGPTIPGEIFGARALDFDFAAGLLRRGYGAILASLSYNGRILLLARGDTGVFKDKGAMKDLLQFAKNELKILEGK